MIAALPGGATLAQVLPALLALEPAAVVPEPALEEIPGAQLEEVLEAPIEEAPRAPFEETRDGTLDGSATGAFAGAGTLEGAFADLPVWLLALHQSLEPASTSDRTAVAVGTAPRRAVPTPVSPLVDPVREAREEEFIADSLAAMSPTAVVEVTAAFKRIESWAAAQVARAAAELASRPELRPTEQRPVPTAIGSPVALQAPALAANTLAKRLGTSEHAAGRLVRTGMSLNGTLYATGEALAAGSIDWAKAQAIAMSLATVPWHVAHAVEDAVLPTAPSRTPGQVRQAVAKALLEVDPDDAARRHTRARAERRVERPLPMPDGMALVRAVLPADAAIRLDATLQAAAKHAKTAGDGRAMDQLRADALDAMSTHAWHAGVINPAGCGGTCCPAEATPAAPPPAAPGPITPAPAAPGADDACRMRLAHVGRRAQINVTVDLTTLLGLTRNPGHLTGYGPISADLVRDLAKDATWRRLITDPVTDLVVDVATTRYRPPENLAELVRLRYPTCIDPVCSVPSDRCDLDHHEEWSSKDPNTSAPNLGPLCRTHHLHKTHGGYSYVATEPGSHEITTPTGHRYRTGRSPDRTAEQPARADGLPPPF